MGSHVIDSILNGPRFTSPEMVAIFSDEARIQKWLDIEAALAQTQAELGMIPKQAAEEITSKAKVELFDLKKLGEAIALVSHNTVPFLRIYEELCEGDAGQFVHYGATTQDIVDTAHILQVKEAWQIIVRDLKAIRVSLAKQAQTHKTTPMAGRSHAQQALPISFGYKVAAWLDEVDRHLERMAEAEKRVLVGNMTGAVGTMASFGGKGFEVQEGTMRRLGLGTPRICWHASRDRFVEIAYILVQVAGTFGKIANEICNLSHTECGEVTEPFKKGKVGSSTMPHKRNPSTSELVCALAYLVRGNIVPMTDALFQEHERDSRCWRIEWAALPEMCIYSGAILRMMKVVIEGMVVNQDKMLDNLNLTGGLILSERIMLALGEKIGKQNAHEHIYEIAMRAQEDKIPFAEMLKADEIVSANLGEAAINELLDPSTYMGQVAEIVDGVTQG